MYKNSLNKIVIMIPSLDPDINMINYVNELITNGAKNIVVIDDGSKNDNKHFFKDICKHKEVILLTHDENKGKGRALKTGFKYVVDNMPDVVGIVTADADGQHATKDTIKVANVLLETNEIVFGTRDFNEEIVPFKSRNGNKITTFVFKLLYGVLIKDTQTGLRGLPIEFAKECIEVEGERFEYEIGMLIKAAKDKEEIIQEPIDTIYINSNRATHFNTFKDSYKIYKVMFKEFFRYSLSSLLSSLIDLTIFSVLASVLVDKNKYVSGIFIATLTARIVSSLINYTINKNKVFWSKENIKTSIIKYYCLVIFQTFLSWLLVTFVYSVISANTTFIKAIVDTFLFIFSYRIQRKYIFK